MTHVAKKISIAILIAVFISILVCSMTVLPQIAFADTAYAIGDPGPGGGIIFYIDEADNYSWDYLEAAPSDLVNHRWSNITDVEIGTTQTGIGTGQANTNIIITQTGHTDSAAKLCIDYVSSTGYDDWFLPSIEEVEKMYEYRAIIGGFNMYSYYWSSSERSDTLAWLYGFEDGIVTSSGKGTEVMRSVRAIRAGTGMKSTEDSSDAVEEPAPWVRDREMTCYQVWINEDNNFEFVFWWEYKNNNWVKIYDLEGSEVFSIDMEKGNARFEADLPDGFYTVKTFHDGFETPIQEFLIGKP